MNSVYAIVVTFNRLELLKNCIRCLAQQTQSPDRIFLINNASTDKTRLYLEEEFLPKNSLFELFSLSENLGGAGGFSFGLNKAITAGAEWIWMMDDDAEATPEALAELMSIARNSNFIYGSLALFENQPSWETKLISPPVGKINSIDHIPAQAEVEMLPLLGLLIHRDLVAKIGLPDAGFFIAGDDAEYCLRAKRAGAKIIIAGHSHIKHPKSNSCSIKICGMDITYLSLPAWKRYYDTRNRILIARKYHGTQLLTKTIPGTILRFLIAIRREPEKTAQARAFFAGIFDGLLGIKGKRHQKWGIKS